MEETTLSPREPSTKRSNHCFELFRIRLPVYVHRYRYPGEDEGSKGENLDSPVPRGCFPDRNLRTWLSFKGNRDGSGGREYAVQKDAWSMKKSSFFSGFLKHSCILELQESRTPVYWNWISKMEEEPNTKSISDLWCNCSQPQLIRVLHRFLSLVGDWLPILVCYKFVYHIFSS